MPVFRFRLVRWGAAVTATVLLWATGPTLHESAGPDPVISWFRGLRFALVLAGSGFVSIESAAILMVLWRRRSALASAAGMGRMILGLSATGVAVSGCEGASTTGPPHLVAPASAPAGTSTVAPSVTTASTTAPHMRARPTLMPAAPAPPARPESPAPTRSPKPVARTWIVKPGDSFWSIAETVVGRNAQGPPAPQVVTRYWSRLIAVNRSHLPRPGDPDLLFPGDELVVPPV